MGAEISPTDDGMIIKGVHKLHGAECNSYDDHRIAMSVAVAALAAEGSTTILDSECSNISFPGFYKLFDTLREA